MMNIPSIPKIPSVPKSAPAPAATTSLVVAAGAGPASAPVSAPKQAPAGKSSFETSMAAPTTARPALVKPVASPPAAVKRPAAFSSKKEETPHSTQEFLFNLLDDCGASNVSDLHVHPGKGMWRLISGKLTKLEGADDIITEEEVVHWMTHADGYEDMNVDDPIKLFGTKGHTTVAFDTGTWRVRGSFRRSTVGISATFRMIPSRIPTLEDVYLPEVMVDMIRRSSGLILIEGPTGSGKTTSIAALIDYINTNENLHIYSVEDPIEFHHKPKGASVFTMREIGVHASDYPSAVENALRSKPNVIFIGEMLSNETKKAALHAATTGHLVITTAHAGSVAEALDSFIGGFDAAEQPQIRGRLAQSLLGVMCQSLIPTRDGKLVAAREVMLTNINFSEIIREDNINMLHAQLESGAGCFTLEQELFKLVKAETIDVKVALERAKQPAKLQEELERHGYMATS
jgi:twitching motility protein PilT